ncbi:MscL family protein [Pedobacter sp.]|nr:MscL family protein [Candidatus Saccharibacteria bacterium]
MATKKPVTPPKRKTALKTRAQAAGARAKAVASGSKLDGFVTFIREKGVVGLAVGLAIGTAATAVVAQIVGAIITPTIVLLIGADGLSSLNTTVTIAGRSATYAFGDLLDALLKFIAIAAAIYFVIMGLRLDRLDKKKED